MDTEVYTDMRQRSRKASGIALKTTKGVLHILVNIIFYMLVILAIMKLGSMAYSFAYQVFGDVAAAQAPGKDIEVTISKNDSASSIASKLELNGVITDHRTFYIRLKLLRKSKVYPGTYTLNNSMTYDDILKEITTKPEGYVDDTEGDNNTTDSNTTNTTENTTGGGTENAAGGKP